MRKEIHPNYIETAVTCGCGNTFTTRSTKEKISVEICSNCHPFYTGKQKFVDAAGRIERFKKKWGDKKAQGQTQKAPKKVAEKVAARPATIADQLPASSKPEAPKAKPEAPKAQPAPEAPKAPEAEGKS